jgi:hypothetical protein
MLMLVLGCGEDALAPASDLAGAPDLAQGIADLRATVAPDLAPSPSYPPGPYGNTVGSTIPPLQWEGYVDPLADALATTKPYGAYSMNDLRRSGRPYGVVHVSLFS